MTNDRFSPGQHQLLLESEKQVILDAAAVLQVRRSEVVAALARGPVPGTDILTSGTPAEMNRQMMAQAAEWRELHSVRSRATVPGLQRSLPNNRRLLENGLRMESIFDAGAPGLGALLLLANEPVGTYLLSFAPINMKIVDRSYVMLQGPDLPDGGETVMAVRTSACLNAAWRYWEVVRRHALPAGEWVDSLTDLTPRQRQVVALMATGITDDAIAAALGVSVRTVRTDVAALLDVLGVRTRFAAGVRLQLWPATDD